jgi:hypothetical protein
MVNRSLGVVFGWAVVLLLMVAPISAQQTDPTDQNKSEQQAMAVLERMAEFLSQAQRFSVTMDIGFDAVQDDGQKIEFGETRKILLSRPDRLRIDTTKRSGAEDEVIFDGKNITVFNPKENVYAMEAKPGTVDQAIAYFVNDLGMRLPLAELLDSNLAKMLPERVREAAYVEKSSIAGVPCDHIALRGEQADMQLWIAEGDKPLPRRIVITYKREDGRPQFRANLTKWNLSPKVRNSMFAFTPPKGAVKIAFSPRQMMQMQPAGTEMKGGK